jgi:hypothetical protein
MNEWEKKKELLLILEMGFVFSFKALMLGLELVGSFF